MHLVKCTSGQCQRKLEKSHLVLLPQLCSPKGHSLFQTGSSHTNAIACIVPHTEKDLFLLPQPSLVVEVLPHPLHSLSEQARAVEIQKNGEHLPPPGSPAKLKKNKGNQERLMNKNNRLSAFLLIISPPQTAVMWKVLKFKSHLSLTSADRLPMQ